MRDNRLNELWGQNKTAINAWLTIPSAWTAEVMAHAGFDAITIDMQHGLADYQTAVAMLQAISTTDVVPLARVPWNDPVIIMRLLDAGAYGLVCPMINNRAEAEAFVGACRYPPAGYRSYGPIRASVYGGADYFQHANKHVKTFAMVETAEALENIEAIVSTPELDGIYIGTVDLSISMGIEGMGYLSNPTLQNALATILSHVKKHNRIAGIHARIPTETAQLIDMGFQLVTPVNDTKLLRGAAESTLAEIRASQENH